MTDDEIRSRHAVQVDAVKAEVKRVERLHAAAPQMLEALKSIVKCDDNLELLSYDELHQRARSAINKCIAAIAAAEGKQ